MKAPNLAAQTCIDKEWCKPFYPLLGCESGSFLWEFFCSGFTWGSNSFSNKSRQAICWWVGLWSMSFLFVKLIRIWSLIMIWPFSCSGRRCVAISQILFFIAGSLEMMILLEWKCNGQVQSPNPFFVVGIPKWKLCLIEKAMARLLVVVQKLSQLRNRNTGKQAIEREVWGSQFWLINGIVSE